MMREIYPNLFIGDINQCFFNEKEGWAVIHACKSPCHQRALGYKGSLPESHPHYLTFQKGNHLFLNIIDPQQPLFKLPLFTESLNYVEKHISKRKVLIHCNHGLSRSPSLALLYLSKRTKIISDKDFRTAYDEFIRIFREFKPGRGISRYLQDNWDQIL